MWLATSVVILPLRGMVVAAKQYASHGAAATTQATCPGVSIRCKGVPACTSASRWWRNANTAGHETTGYGVGAYAGSVRTGMVALRSTSAMIRSSATVHDH